jgi:hypothetical protein
MYRGTWKKAQRDEREREKKIEGERERDKEREKIERKRERDEGHLEGRLSIEKAVRLLRASEVQFFFSYPRVSNSKKKTRNVRFP